MKTLYTLLIGCLFSTSLLAQTNYVANTPNSLTPANGNTLVGPGAGNSAMTGTGNSFFGMSAGQSSTSAVSNSFFGANAGANNTTGGFNSFMGWNAGGLNTTGTSNVFIGYQAGFANSTASKNVFVGWNAGYNNTSGFANVFVGSQAGEYNSTGAGNMFLGQLAGASNNGSYNMFIGNGAGQLNSTGDGNTFIGDGAGRGNFTGTNNTYIGRYTNYLGNNEGNQNTFIGYRARASVDSDNRYTVNNSTAIGFDAVVIQDNSVILGGPGAKVGIGNSAPKNSLEISKGIANQSGLRFTNLTSSSPASLTSVTKFLTVNAQGDVILGSLNSSAREGISESFWQRKDSFLQSTQNDAVIIGTNVARTPSGYKLFVEEGILTEKVKVAVKNTSEWSDFVFRSGYRLKPLSEVEQYIQVHAHLPGIPSAKEMVEKGNDLHKTDAKLLEKIEELTLYSIDQNKKIERQQKENQQLKAEMAELKVLMKLVLKKK